MAFGPARIIYTLGDPGTFNHTHTLAVNHGDVVVVGNATIIANAELAANQRGGYLIDGAIIQVPKPTGGGSAMAVGTRVYWDVADGNAQNTADSGTNKHLGIVAAANTDSDTTMLVLKTAQA